MRNLAILDLMTVNCCSDHENSVETAISITLLCSDQGNIQLVLAGGLLQLETPLRLCKLCNRRLNLEASTLQPHTVNS